MNNIKSDSRVKCQLTAHTKQTMTNRESQIDLLMLLIRPLAAMTAWTFQRKDLLLMIQQRRLLEIFCSTLKKWKSKSPAPTPLNQLCTSAEKPPSRWELCLSSTCGRVSKICCEKSKYFPCSNNSKRLEMIRAHFSRWCRPAKLTTDCPNCLDTKLGKVLAKFWWQTAVNVSKDGCRK
jgi:hypothetical protein